MVWRFEFVLWVDGRAKAGCGGWKRVPRGMLLARGLRARVGNVVVAEGVDERAIVKADWVVSMCKVGARPHSCCKEGC